MAKHQGGPNHFRFGFLRFVPAPPQQMARATAATSEGLRSLARSDPDNVGSGLANGVAFDLDALIRMEGDEIDAGALTAGCER